MGLMKSWNDKRRAALENSARQQQVRADQLERDGKFAEATVMRKRAERQAKTAAKLTPAP